MATGEEEATPVDAEVDTLETKPKVQSSNFTSALKLKICWSLGEKDTAIHYLLQCVEKRMGVVAILIDHPMFKGMADDVRYQLLKEKLNLIKK